MVGVDVVTGQNHPAGGPLLGELAQSVGRVGARRGGGITDALQQHHAFGGRGQGDGQPAHVPQIDIGIDDEPESLSVELQRLILIGDVHGRDRYIREHALSLGAVSPGRFSRTTIFLHSRQPISIRDRKSTRLNSSHVAISYAVFCLKKKNNGATNSYAKRLLY